MPPWEIERSHGSALWANRFVVYRQEQNKVQQDEAKRARMKRG